MPKLPIAITMGEPNGIAPEIVLSAWQKKRQYNLPPFFYLADAAVLRHISDLYKTKIELAIIESPSQALDCFEDALPVLPRTLLTKPIRSGHSSSEHAKPVIDAIIYAIDYALSGQIAAIVTAPVSKENLSCGYLESCGGIGIKGSGSDVFFSGHTEFIADKVSQIKGRCYNPVMLMASRDFRCASVTTHIALKDVPTALSQDNISLTIEITLASLRRFFGIGSPRIAVCSLNPHAGENGRLGMEEKTIITPAIKRCQQSEPGAIIDGPLAADSLFCEGNRQKYDCFIAMYHDQSLIAAKILDFHGCVNITLGLPLIRTSPDHGTAYDIAGKSLACASSMIAAISRAAALAEVRQRSD